MNIFPEPKQIELTKKSMSVPCGISFRLTKLLTAELCKAATSLEFANEAFKNNNHSSALLVSNAHNSALGREEYIIRLSESKAEVEHGGTAGFYYAVQTLCSLAKGGEWGTAVIHDAPAVSLRGALLDIGRDKIPTMETLYSYIDLFALLRYNHLELYMEGYCFEYKKYKHLFSDATPITAQEFLLLSRYAKARFIDLVPNQNCLGHMDQWLAKPTLRELAECPDGFLHQNLYMRQPMTLDANNDEAFDLVDYFLKELLPNSDSDYVNINADEPFELGRGKNKELCDEIGVGKVYIDYILKINEQCAAYGKKIMLWGDVVFNHPEIIELLPPDAILLDWIYEGDASFKAHCEAMKKAKCEFCLCPGTSSWATFTGRSDNAYKNVNDAVENAIAYGAKGVIITDWGDMGHWQYFTISKHVFAACANAMWTGKPIDTNHVRMLINREVFADESELIYDTLYTLGNYYKLEHSAIYNATLSFSLMCNKYTFNNKQEFDNCVERLIKLCENIAHENSIIPEVSGINPDYEAINALLDKTLTVLPKMRLGCQDAKLVLREIENAVSFIRHGLRLYKIMSEYTMANRRELSTMTTELEQIFAEHYDLWMQRNRSGGFTRSSAHFNHLISLYKKEAVK